MSTSRLGYLILCDAHGKVAGKDCLYGVFNRIFVGSFPAQHEQCYLAFELWTDPGDHHLHIEVHDTDGQLMAPPMGPIEIKVSEAGQGSGAIQLRGLPLARPGIYSFVLKLDEEVAGIRDLIVEPAPQRR